MATTAIPYFLYAFGILLREGLEALLVVVALAAGVRQMGRASKVREIYLGAGLGIVVSLLLAWGVNALITDNDSDAMEGVFQIVAALTLFYVSSWLTAKTQASRWQEFLQKQIVQQGRRAIPLAFGLSAFLAVLREGAETIVFFQALLGGASAGTERHAIWAGMGLAAIALALVFFGLQGVLARIPLRHFFRVTSLLLYGLAVVFIGQAVGSLQEAEVVGATFIAHVPTIPVLGIFPTVQSLAAQTVLLVLAAAAWFVPRHSTGGEARDIATKPQRTASVRAH
ncbi:MAG TPA: FTR1 family protein [Candidatus Binataceae bacterium]|nr:FTR1 family protein [Candidatus Binataceae bacterium]